MSYNLPCNISTRKYTQKNTRRFICNNCGIYGHLFYKCKKPIMSFGIISYRNNEITNNVEYLMIRRKDSLGYVDFIRGKYSLDNITYIINFIGCFCWIRWSRNSWTFCRTINHTKYSRYNIVYICEIP